MKYKVIKSFPWYNWGEIYDTQEYSITFNPVDYPEFFELIEEKPKTVWDLKEGDRYWFVVPVIERLVPSVISSIAQVPTDMYNDVFSCEWGAYGVDFARRNTWNCFLTQAETEKELEKRTLITKLLRSKHEMGLNKKFVIGEENSFIFQWHNSSIYYSVTNDTNLIPILWYFSKDSQEYIEKNKTDLLRLFELTK